MRIESAVTSVTWIPSEAIEGMPKLPFELGIAHYDEPPSETLGNLDKLRDADAFREANELRAWIEAKRRPPRRPRARGPRADRRHPHPARPGTARLSCRGGPLIQREPEVATAGSGSSRPRAEGWVCPLPGACVGSRSPALLRLRMDDAPADPVFGRPVEGIAGRREPVPPPLGLRPRGAARREVGDDRFREVVPRVVRREHAVGRRRHACVRHRGRDRARARPLGIRDEARRKAAEAPPRVGATLVEQGTEGDDLFVLLDGVLDVEVDGETVAEVGPGAILGERAAIEEVRARRPCGR